MTETLSPKEQKRVLKWAKKHVKNYEHYTAEELDVLSQMRTMKSLLLLDNPEYIIASGMVKIPDGTHKGALQYLSKKSDVVDSIVTNDTEPYEELRKEVQLTMLAYRIRQGKEAEKVKKNLKSFSK